MYMSGKLTMLMIVAAVMGIFAACENKSAVIEPSIKREEEIAPDNRAKEADNNSQGENLFVAADEKRMENLKKDIDNLSKQLSAYVKLSYDIENSAEDRALSERVHEELEKLYTDMENLDDFHIALRLQFISAMFHDGHMVTDFMFSDYYETSYPIYFNIFEEEPYCIAVYNEEYENMLNCKAVAINGVEIDEIFERFRLLFSGDNIYNSRQWFGRRLHCPAILKALDIIKNIDDPALFTLVDSAGNSFDMQIEQNLTSMWVDEISSRVKGDEAYYNSKDELVWMDYLREDKLMYVRMYYIPASNELSGMDNALNGILENNEIDKSVVDVRGNEGGMVASIRSGFFDTLISCGAENGNLYVITDHDTFSMGATIAMYLKEKGGATVIGLASGGAKPYIGAPRNIMISGLGFAIIIPTQNSYKNGAVDFVHTLENNSLEPDIEIGISIEDYVNKKDPVLDLIKAIGR